VSELALPASLFLAGLASGLHCAGMCGGIAAGFSVLQRGGVLQGQIAFNLGRVTSYAAAGAAAGAVGAAAYATGALPVQAALYLVASLVLVLAGAHLLGLASPLRRLDALGMPLWRRLQPLAARLMTTHRFAAGLAWGWLPCGLVYAALLAAALAGDPARGALAMLAFGLGTLPWLLAAGIAAARVRGWMRLRPVRLASGGVLTAAGAWGAAHASGLSETLRQSLLCLG
jgi:sulfite exporter TauE/SafE